jgi:hypothetical protein
MVGMDERTTTPAPEAGCLSQVGLAVIIGLAAAPLLGLTVLFPPWIKVHCQRQEMLYFSQRVKIYEQSFAGFDFVFSDQKWSRSSSATVVGSGQLFDSTEYDVSRPLLAAEWAIVIAMAVAVFVMRSKRLRSGVQQSPTSRLPDSP